MRLLLLQPPVDDFYDTSIRTYPLGLSYLAAKISNLCDVVVLDARTGFKPKAAEEEPPPGLEDYYRPDRASPFSLFQRYRRFGMSRQALAQRLAVEKPDILAISSLFTTYSTETVELARIAKSIDPGIFTVVGGIHATLFPEDLLSDPSVDFVIRGEGETPLRRLVEALTKGESGELPEICFQDGGGFHLGPVNVEKEIDLLPDRSFLRAGKYRIGKKRYGAMITTRGCPNRCSFCGKPPVPYRKRSLNGIEAELADCMERGIEAIDFQDDMLTGDLPFFQNVLKGFAHRQVTLSAMNGIYSEGLEDATLDLMHEAGFRRLNFSLVDASEQLLSRQNRASAASFVRLLPYLEASPFLPEVHFIVGLPSQTPADVLQTILFLMGKRLLLGPSIFYLAPGSPIFKKTIGKEWGPLRKSMRSSAMLSANPSFSRPTTYTFMKLVRFINYIKGLLDRQEIPGRISDCTDSFNGEQSLERQILRILLREKKFVWQDTVTGDLLEEPQDFSLVQSFFSMAKGQKIKGFRTQNSLVVDV